MIFVFSLSLMWVSSLNSSWWLIAIIAYMIGLSSSSLKSAVFNTALPAFLLWFFTSLWLGRISQGLAETRVSEILGLPWTALIYPIVGFIGGVLAGLFGATGFLYKDAFRQLKLRRANLRQKRYEN